MFEFIIVYTNRLFRHFLIYNPGYRFNTADLCKNKTYPQMYGYEVTMSIKLHVIDHLFD